MHKVCPIGYMPHVQWAQLMVHDWHTMLYKACTRYYTNTRGGGVC